MAFYKEAKMLQPSQDARFDAANALPPGSKHHGAGIYRCVSCGHEIGIAKDHTLPPQNYHVHPNSLPIKWQLIVGTTH